MKSVCLMESFLFRVMVAMTDNKKQLKLVDQGLKHHIDDFAKQLQ